MIKLTDIAHEKIKVALIYGGIAIDATVGNGFDTLFLAQFADRVYGFDIQQVALEKTLEKARENGFGDKVELFNESHESLGIKFEENTVDAIMFNLGYLPGGDKSIITHASSTLKALEGGLKLLRSGGVMSVMSYPGHFGGDEEDGVVMAWFYGLSGEYKCEKIDSSSASGPRLIVIQKV